MMAEKGTYSDPRCATCNPPGWQEVDGVKLPPITWGEPVTATVSDENPHRTSTEDKQAVAERLLVGPKPYHSGRFFKTPESFRKADEMFNRWADKINQHIAPAHLMTVEELYRELTEPAEQIEHEAVRTGRAE